MSSNHTSKIHTAGLAHHSITNFASRVVFTNNLIGQTVPYNDYNWSIKLFYVIKMQPKEMLMTLEIFNTYLTTIWRE
jgi:hypothetical protein